PEPGNSSSPTPPGCVVFRSGSRSGRVASGVAARSCAQSEIHGWFRRVTEPVGLLDTGPLVSFLAAGLEYHEWAVEQWRKLRPPLLTCEPVLTEAAFLLKREGRDADALFALLERGVIRVALAVEEQQAGLRALNNRFCQRPISLADACLGRLSENPPLSEV